jgi:parallel beta-helix repeat protein
MTSSAHTTIDSNNIDENCGGDSGIEIRQSSDDFLIINNNVTNGTGHGIWIDSSDGQILNNNISGNTYYGIWAGGTTLNVSNNTITYNNNEGINFGGSVTANVWHNNIHNNSGPQVSSSSAIELSFGGEGNYWGRSSCPVFIPGTDSNNVGVVDSYPYTAVDGWLSTSPTVCCGGASGACTCGDTVVGDVLLTSDLNATGDCLTIEIDGITIDCDGYTLTGQQNGDGVIINGYDNITVENCDITNFTTNIYINNSVGNDIINNNVSFDLVSNYGIYLSKVNDTLIKDNYVFENYYGIYLTNSSSNTMQDNIILNNSNSGIYLTDSSNDNKIIGGEIGHNNKPSGSSMRGGIRIGYSSRNNITGVYLHNNAYNAIVLLTCENNTIDGNNIDSNCGGNAGIYLQDSADNNVIQNNNITNGTGHGIESYYSDGIQVLNNYISDNTNDGIYIYDANNITIDNNDILSNNNRGIYIGFSTNGIIIDNNDIQDNCEGIYLSSAEATIIDTDFNNNNCSITTGLYVSSSSTAHLRNGDFIDNGLYGILNPGGETVNWNITEEITCRNNNLSFWGPYPNIDGGSITLDNCVIRINNSIWNISSGLEEFNEYGLNVTAGATTELGNSSVGFSVEVTGNENDTVDLSVEEYSSNPGGSGYALKSLGKYIRFETSADINVSSIIIKVYYSDAEVAAAGLDESTLRLEYYNATSGTWTKYDPPNGGVNTAENYVWAETTHFSIWGLFGSTPSTPSAPSGGGRVTGAAGGRYYLNEEPLTVTLSGIDKIHFEVDGEAHVTQLHSLGEDYVILSMATTVIKVRVNLDQTTKIDVNNDMIYDLAITLNEVSTIDAELTFQKIAEERPIEAPAITEAAPLVEEVPEEVEEEVAQEKKEMNYLVLVLLGALVVIIVIALYPKHKKKK